MTSKQGNGLSSTRVQGLSLVNTTHLECPICHELLWKPVACHTCEKPFCSACICQWLSNHPNQCPNQCATYVERKCPPLCASLLAELQISCFYLSQGCEQVFSYEALDQHEANCGFEPQRCSGCRLEISKKDLINHENQCGSIELSCRDCKLVYKRQDAAIKHIETLCLKEQLRQVRQVSEVQERTMQELVIQLAEIRLTNVPKRKRTIDFSDLPDATMGTKRMPTIYQGMQWTGVRYRRKEYANAKQPKSGYRGAFIPDGSSHAAYFRDDASLCTEFPNSVFTLVSITACAAWNDDLQLTITGHRRSTQVDTHTLILLFGKPQMIFLQWENIDMVLFESSGGTPHSEEDEDEDGSHVILTKLTLIQ